MSAMPGQEGLRLDQAPPLSLPLAFFLTVPAAMVAAGILLILQGAALLVTPWAPATIALTHLGTLGVLGMAMCGAIYQMIPVVAGVPVPLVRLGHLVHVLLVLGTAALAAGLLHEGQPWLFSLSLSLLGPGLILFLAPVTWAIWRAPTRSPTVTGMRLALGSLAAVAVLGVLMAWQYAAVAFSVYRPWLLQVHLTLGLLGWVGGLISAVSWQVVPMFYLAQPVPHARAKALLRLLGVGLSLTLSGLFIAPAFAISPSFLLGCCSVPAALAVWIVAPALTAQSLRARRRPRPEASLRAWQVASSMAPCVGVAALLAVWSDDSRWNLTFGWTAIWGWAGLTIHAMLMRIVPFLVWFHRFSRFVGLVPVPPMNHLLPDRRARIGLGLHLVCLASGLGAIASSWGWLAQATGAWLVATGVWLGRGLWLALQHRAPQAPI